jgi:iron complex transport system substrate-binding protein
MRTFYNIYFSFLFLALLAGTLTSLPAPARAADSPVEITDDRGQAVRLPAPAKRIVPLYGAFNEILGAMGLADRIIARTRADELPPEILDRPVIGTHMRPNAEMIVALKPDLALQMGGRDEAVLPLAELEARGVPVAFFQANSFEELFGVIRRLGLLTGEPGAAARLEDSLRARLARVAGLLGPDPVRPRVFFEVRHPNLLAAGRKSMVSEVIERAGGRNCVEADAKLARLGEEELLRLNPEAYLRQRGAMNQDPAPPQSRPGYGLIQAVKTGRVLTVDEGRYSRPGPRSVEAVEELAAFLHPEIKDKLGPVWAGEGQ